MSGLHTGRIIVSTGLQTLGIKEEKMRLCVTMSRKSFLIYSNATSDIEFLFPFGWGELWGIADSTDYDLTAAP